MHYASGVARHHVKWGGGAPICLLSEEQKENKSQGYRM